MKPLCLLVVSALAVVPLGAEPDGKQPVPIPEAMQQMVWDNSKLSDFRLEGMVRTDKNLHPIILRTRGREMVYEFQKQPLQIRVVMTESGSVIQRRKSATADWVAVTGKERLARILDSDVAYEDLGLDFLRWRQIRPLGADSIKTLAAWSYEAVPAVMSNYAKARYWISSEYLAVLRVDAYNPEGSVIKRVEVNGVMKVGAVYTIKEMQISNMIPGRDLSASRTYIEIRKAEPGSGL
ncbi:MAG: outer membrane lipoprotein-sorting protein [Candidatus Methylacidiphilales bacterium]|nr:outer membrane lipoprotein-sorting protein [Candidatus Methylacidiphilales bacterium]